MTSTCEETQSFINILLAVLGGEAGVITVSHLILSDLPAPVLVSPRCGLLGIRVLPHLEVRMSPDRSRLLHNRRGWTREAAKNKHPL